MEHGPVDVVVVATGEPKFNGSVLNELERLVKEGTIRVLDAMVLVKGDDGKAMSVEIEDLPDVEKSALGFIETGTRGLFDEADAHTVIEGMGPGSAVVALAIENVWAKGLIQSLKDAGAEIAMDIRVPAAVVDDTYASLSGVR